MKAIFTILPAVVFLAGCADPDPHAGLTGQQVGGSPVSVSPAPSDSFEPRPTPPPAAPARASRSRPASKPDSGMTIEDAPAYNGDGVPDDPVLVDLN